MPLDMFAPARFCVLAFVLACGSAASADIRSDVKAIFAQDMAQVDALKIDRTSGQLELPQPTILPGLSAAPSPPPTGKAAVYARNRQLCLVVWLRSCSEGFLIPEHGVGDGQEFASHGDEDDLCGLAGVLQAPQHGGGGAGSSPKR